MSECTKGKVYENQCATNVIDIVSAVTGYYVVAQIANENDELSIENIANAKELVRRWNAFEEGGLVDELKKACEEVRGWLDTSSLQQVLVHYTEDERRHALIMGIATNLERLEAALAKS